MLQPTLALALFLPRAPLSRPSDTTSDTFGEVATTALVAWAPARLDRAGARS